MRNFMTLVLAVPISSLVVVACSNNGGGNPLGGDGNEGSSGSGALGDDASASSGDNTSLGSSGSGGGMFNAVDAGGPHATDCKGGHYAGSFTGKYTSSLTSFLGLGGVALNVMGDLQMDIQETVTMTTGELPTVTFSIANGSISGTANGIVPYHCELVGTLDCDTKKLVDGVIACTYCAGAIGPLDSGTCLTSGHFAGPFNSDYDGSTFSFVNGTWNGSEGVTLDDAGALSVPDSGGVNDAGLYMGSGSFGGSGTWTAAYVADN
jgi:hypothetical protein